MSAKSDSDSSDVTGRIAPATARSFAEGRYIARRVLGEGGQKIVYLVHDEALDRDCALALLKTELLERDDLARLRREAQAMARLDHPNIVAVHDIGDDDGRPFFVCQYVAGGDLREELHAADGPLPFERAVAVSSDVCAALAAAHARGVIHRDIKPGNIWLTEDGTAKLGDFGLAISHGRSLLTLDGGLQGTAAYMPPERALGQTADERSDLYALGCVLYEMLTGRPPFLGDDVVSVITQHIETSPVAPSWHNRRVPPELESLTLRLLAKSPDDRPVSAEDVREALLAVSSSTPIAGTGSVANRATSLDRLAGGVFVGREREVGELRFGLDEALSGHARLLLLVGEPGIGKTRTANELCTYARLRGAQVLVGRCYEGEGAPAYWPWVQAIRSYVQESDPDELRTEMGPGAANIAQIVSEVEEQIPGLAPPPHLEPDQARFRLFESITSFLRNVARRRPLVLLLDDLHWADKASLLMLQFLARDFKDARLLVLGTYRDVELGRQHPLAQTLAELAREQVGTRVLLRGLDDTEVARYIEMTSGMVPPEALVTAVYRETEGNPFFLSEVVRLLVADGRLQDAGEMRAWTVTIPQSVREVVGRRLEHLSEECNRMLTIAAVIGREFNLAALERLTEHSAERVLALVEEGEAARVIGEAAGRAVIGRYSFSHALIRESLYTELSRTRRVRLHKQIGEVLEALYGEDVEPHLAELAHHFGEAAAAGDVQKALDYAERAGTRAMTINGWEDATLHYEHALLMVELQQPPDDRARGRILLGLGEAVKAGGDPEKGRLVLEQAIEVAERAHTPDVLARAALALGSSLVATDMGRRNEAAIPALERALDTLPGQDSELRANVLARLSLELALSSENGRAKLLSTEAIAMASRIEAPRALVAALIASQWVAVEPERADEFLAISARVLRSAIERQDVELQIHIIRARQTLLLQLGDPSQIERELPALQELAGVVRQPFYRWAALTAEPLLAGMRGDFELAERLSQEALAFGQRAKAPNAMLAFAAHLLALRSFQGRLHELEQPVQLIANQYPIPGLWDVVIAWIDAEKDVASERMRNVLERIGAKGFGSLRRDQLWLARISMLSDICVELEDAAAADGLYRVLLPIAGRVITVESVACVASAARHLGRLAALMNRWPESEHHFETALLMDGRLGPPLLAWTQYHFACALLARNGPGGRERASKLLGQSLATAGELGMAPLARKIERLATGN